MTYLTLGWSWDGPDRPTNDCHWNAYLSRALSLRELHVRLIELEARKEAAARAGDVVALDALGLTSLAQNIPHFAPTPAGISPGPDGVLSWDETHLLMRVDAPGVLPAQRWQLVPRLAQ